MQKEKLNGLALSSGNEGGDNEENKDYIYSIEIAVTKDDNIELGTCNYINNDEEISLLMIYGVLSSVLKLIECSINKNSISSDS